MVHATGAMELHPKNFGIPSTQQDLHSASNGKRRQHQNQNNGQKTSMGNEISEIATDAAVDALIEGADIDVDLDANVDVASGAVEEAVEELQQSFETFQLDEAEPEDNNYFQEDGNPLGSQEDYGAESHENHEEEHDYEDEDDYDYGEDEDEEVADRSIHEESDGLFEEGFDANNEDFEASQPGFALDIDEWDGVEIGETEDGLFDDDVSILRNDVSLLGDGGLDVYEGIDPMEPIDWESVEFFSYDMDELSTATDIELTSLGYPPEPIPGTSTEDILFSTEMMKESTIPPGTYSPAMVEASQRLADKAGSIADSIGDLRRSLL